MWEFVDKIVYINLDHREDRRTAMTDFFKQGNIPEEKVLRFSAIRDPNGMHGCVKSHIKVLQLAKKNQWNRVLIFEDDVCWTNFEEGYKKLEELVALPTWDVCMLGGSYVETADPRITVSYCSHAYIVKSHYYDTLLNNYITGLHFRQNYLTKSPRVKAVSPLTLSYFNIDNYWIKLQVKDTWIGVISPLCNQIASYSDIEKSNVRAKNKVPDRVVSAGLYLKQLIQAKLV